MKYLKRVKIEAKKVHWPTMDETLKNTGIVIGVCSAFAILFWAVNTGVLAIFKALI